MRWNLFLDKKEEKSNKIIEFISSKPFFGYLHLDNQNSLSILRSLIKDRLVIFYFFFFYDLLLDA